MNQNLINRIENLEKAFLRLSATLAAANIDQSCDFCGPVTTEITSLAIEFKEFCEKNNSYLTNKDFTS